jgi:hypothetical protein
MTLKLLNFLKKEDSDFQNDEVQAEIPKKVKSATQKERDNYG